MGGVHVLLCQEINVFVEKDNVFASCVDYEPTILLFLICININKSINLKHIKICVTHTLLYLVKVAEITVFYNNRKLDFYIFH